MSEIIEKNKGGRPKKENKKDIAITFMVDKEEDEKITKLAEKFKMSKARFVRNVIMTNVDNGIIINSPLAPAIQHLIAAFDKMKGVDYWAENEEANKEASPKND